MRVYIAGPMTGLDDFNYPAFHEQARALRASGYDVVNPAESFGGDQSLPWDEYLKDALKRMLECDAVSFLPGWEKSKGATLEFNTARAVGLGIFDHQMRALNDPNSAFRGVHGMYTSETGGQKLNVGKVRLELLPPEAIIEVAKVLTFGAEKYAPNNWRKGLSWDFTIGSILRHTTALMRGEDVDPETGLTHAAHLACQALFLTQFMATGTGEDDRYKP